MKTAKDPRHKQRVDTIKQLFAESFSNQGQESEDLNKIDQLVDKIDALISDAAPQWPIDKLNKIDLAILRYAVYELAEKDTPMKVVVDEAIEISKEYGSENTPSFINAVLGTIIKKYPTIKL